MSAHLLRLLAVALACTAFAHAADAQGRRIALVIGNGNYQHTDLPKLPNPPNDAEDIAKALRGFGFEVIERKNQTLEGMNQAIAEFGSKIGGSEAALFYFAGHGIQVKNQNYLIPVNAVIESEASVAYQGVNVNQILDEMDNGKSSANIVMLDACRNNPIGGKFRSGKSRGLASPGSAPKGTVIVYATDPGNVASDGPGRNGLFTAGLLTAFKSKDLSLDGVLTVASAEVERASGQAQTPYVNGPKTLQKNFHFRVTVDPGRGEIEKTFWTSIERSTDPADFEAYLKQYPKGSYQALAENKLKRLKTEQQTLKETTDKQQSTERNREDSNKASSGLLPGKVFKDCSNCPEMVVIPAGTFEMGSPRDEKGRTAAENSEHKVTIAKPFALAKTEITRGQYSIFVTESGYPTSNECWIFLDSGKWEKQSGYNWRNVSYPQQDNHPVNCVSWDDAKAYVNWLSSKTGRTYHLPSEAEWEYAARAGSTSARYWGNDPDQACGFANVGDQTMKDQVPGAGKDFTGGHNCADGYPYSAPVASFKPNAFGLYDMLGNVWELTEDCWNASYSGAPSDGSAWLSGDCTKHVRRGGSWSVSPSFGRAAVRRLDGTKAASSHMGFRPARTLP